MTWSRSRRGPYCGAIGWVDADTRTAALAVGIRTFWLEDGMLNFGTGAGITWGSDPAGEWAETELKAARLVALASGTDARTRTRSNDEGLAGRRRSSTSTRRRVSAFDHGLTVGDGVFETMKVDRRGPLRPESAPGPARTVGRGARSRPARLTRSFVRPWPQVLDGQRGARTSGRLRITVTGGPGPLGTDRGYGRPDGPRGVLGSEAVAAVDGAGDRPMGTQRALGCRRCEDDVVRRERRGSRLRQGPRGVGGAVPQHQGPGLRGHRQQRVSP